MNSTQYDLLLNEILDGETIERPWAQWAAAADVEPALWRRLAEAQRDELAMARSMNRAASIVESVDAPARAEHRNRETVVCSISSSGDAGRRSIWSWTGWAMAAMLMLAAAVWKLQQPAAMNNQQRPIANTAGFAAAPEDLIKQYLETGKREGSVIGELPARIVLDARPAENGIGYEIIFLRQIQERARVPDLYQKAGEDERGRGQYVSYEPPAGNPM